MTRNKVLGGIGGLVVAAVLAIVVFFTFIREDAPDEFELRTSEEIAESDAADGDNSETDDSASEDPPSEADEADEADEAGATGVEGMWTAGPESVAGYRVVEDFASGLKDFEAVGRTNVIDGFLTIEGTTVTTANFEVDIATITSDSGTRDNQFTGPIMNADEFPTAKFVLTSAIELNEIPGDATPISTTATGDLTLRGVTRAVEVAIDAQVVAGEIEVVGNIDVLFSDFEIDNPSNPAVEVRDEGNVEFQLIFIR